jgi:hypothetical protein
VAGEKAFSEKRQAENPLQVEAGKKTFSEKRPTKRPSLRRSRLQDLL